MIDDEKGLGIKVQVATPRKHPRKHQLEKRVEKKETTIIWSEKARAIAHEIMNKWGKTDAS